MGRIIRSTVTITITKNWTIVWTTDETLPPQATTIVQEHPKPQEEPDETILPAVTTDAGTDAQPTGVSPELGAGSQRKHSRCRRAVASSLGK